MEIRRDIYLEKLIRKKENGLVKVITGLRRVGKTYLLFNIYHDYLRSIGVDDDHIIMLSLEEMENVDYLNPLKLHEYIKNKLIDSKMHYVFIDEVQLVKPVKNPAFDDKNEKITFVNVLLSLMKKSNVDLYVTGSNSKFLSSDVVTEFRGRGDEIRVKPLSYKEFYEAYVGDKHLAFKDYLYYGGMPFILSCPSVEEKSAYLKSLFEKIYLSDVLERRNVQEDEGLLSELLNVIASNVGSLSNPRKLSNTLSSEEHILVDHKQISRYLSYFEDAFLISKVKRYDIRGKRYIDSPFKYYFEDVGLRNARLNFSQVEKNHLMENLIYNELTLRGFNVDIGIVEINERNKKGVNQRKQLEVDFVANKGSYRCYIQSCLFIGYKEKRMQEERPLLKINDSFKKIIVIRDDMIPHYDDNGIFFMGIEDFLLNQDLLN